MPKGEGSRNRSIAKPNLLTLIETSMKLYVLDTDKDCLPFDVVASKSFDQLRAQKIRIGTNDLAIAAITLSVRVTRNDVDFQRVPGLVFEDWSK